MLWGNIKQAGGGGGQGVLVKGMTILNKVSGKAHCGGDIWAKTEAGEAGSLAGIWGKSKWKSGAGGVCLEV